MQSEDNFFRNQSIDEDARRNIAFQVLVAGRDLLQLADKEVNRPHMKIHLVY